MNRLAYSQQVGGVKVPFGLRLVPVVNFLTCLILGEFAGGLEGSEILYRRKDGSEFWAAVFISPVLDETGGVVQYFASFVDLTKHKEEQVRSEMLIDELNHRVKNTLSTVQSIVGQALRTASDSRSIRESIESRLFALSRSHDLLTRGNWESAGLLDFMMPWSRSLRMVGRSVL